MSGAIGKTTFCAIALATAVIISDSAPASAYCADLCQRYIHPISHEVVGRYTYSHGGEYETPIDGYIWFKPEQFSSAFCRRMALSTCNIANCSSIWVDVWDGVQGVGEPIEVTCPRRFLSPVAIGLDE
jgi:hypothetical protein